MSDTVAIRAKMLINGVNPYIRVTSKHAKRLKANWRRPIPVLVRVNGQPNPPWRINLMPMGNGSFYLYLHGSVRKASRSKVGDVVTVEMRFDERYTAGPASVMPAWFVAALKRNPTAQRGWKQLRPSRQKEIARYLAGLKSQTARQRNLEKALRLMTVQK